MALSAATIESTIAAIESSGQSVTIDGQSYTQASLPALYAMLKQERNAALRTGGSRPLFRGFGLSGMGYGDSNNSDSSPTPVIS